MQLKCPFAAPITKRIAGCRNAQEVVRRGGSEIDCRSDSAHAVCAGVFDGLKAQALPAFGFEDDLTVMPHSVLVKIQSGGLAGLQRVLGQAATDGRVPDIGDLVGQAVRRYGSPEQLPYADIESDVVSFKLERRTRRG